eukprot:TRINITY_DN10317_c0_g1_i1.p1 TRINITY_DN10317_c0_g1~~TRINITY_DN10317_c0_g1_i1.p1  ORF type:complete len:615 (+),score=121.16 TRINITY_DN10317_c0_g1_i1:39-1883(+)
MIQRLSEKLQGRGSFKVPPTAAQADTSPSQGSISTEDLALLESLSTSLSIASEGESTTTSLSKEEFHISYVQECDDVDGKESSPPSTASSSRVQKGSPESDSAPKTSKKSAHPISKTHARVDSEVKSKPNLKPRKFLVEEADDEVEDLEASEDEVVDFVDMLRSRSKSNSFVKQSSSTIYKPPVSSVDSVDSATMHQSQILARKKSQRSTEEGATHPGIARKKSSLDVMKTSMHLPRLLLSPSFNHILVELPDETIQDTIRSFKECATKPDLLKTKVPRSLIFRILSHAAKSCAKISNIIELPIQDGIPITVCGDIHGKYFDLLRIFEINGFPSEQRPYLFNGDLVDRGAWGLEVLLTILMLHIRYPSHVYIIRGNHESRRCTDSYGFRSEVEFKYDTQVYEACLDLFDVLPVAALITNHHTYRKTNIKVPSNVFVVHGGLYRDELGSRLGTLDTLRKINRVGEPEDLTILDALWSDPSTNRSIGFRPNAKRGLGIEFGTKAVVEFMKQNDVRLFIRSHQNPTSNTGSTVLSGEGYDLHSISDCGYLVTVFSVPDYLGCKNKGAFMVLFADNSFAFRSYGVAPQPESPSFMQKPPEPTKKGSTYGEASASVDVT